MHLEFAANNTFKIEYLKDLETFVDTFQDSKPVWFNDIEELQLFLQIINIELPPSQELNHPELIRYWDISHYQLPEFTQQEFDQFYPNWIETSKRDNTMNEYGQLLFLHSLSTKWNKLNHRIIVETT
ncbi:MAG: hypothetical protein MK212_01290 [Saprospiraceae bacterium]|nr:hypothetical protein [Saprospiraceae bacterium]